MADKKIRGSYIPDDHPDVIKKQERREKAKENTKKLTDFLSPVLTKKFKKELKEEYDQPVKKSTTKFMVGDKINRKAKKMTKTEGSFAKGGRAGYKGGKSVKKMGCAIKGKSPILR